MFINKFFWLRVLKCENSFEYILSQKGKHKGGLKLATKKRKGLIVRIKEAINKIILENEDITPSHFK